MERVKELYIRYLAKIRRSAKGRGILNSILLIPKRYFQTFKFREFDLGGVIDKHQLDGPVEVKEHAEKFESSNPVFFRKMFDNLDWPFQNSTFVDFGCGKGASLVYASELGFKKVIGVEYSSSLARIAESNMEKLSNKIGRKVENEIINSDAALYEIPSEADCFYFFNPFDAFILDRVIQNINKSLEINNRKILIVYVNALHNQVIEKYNYQIVKHFTTKELDIYYLGGAYVYKNF
jgi:SAM-dependent methyltransferase